jgi:hypothetical protein
VPNQKLGLVMETLQSESITPAIAPFLPDPAGAFRLSSTHVEPPEYLWAVYRQGGRRVTFKCLFYEDQYKDYVGFLERTYPDRVDRPDHPRGGISFVPEINGVLWGFPFDPAMPGLPDCVDGEWAAGVLNKRDPVLSHTMTYQPEIGALLTYRRGGDGRLVAYGKVSPEENSGLIYVVMNRLWNSEARESGRLRLAQPLAFRPQHGLLLQAPVPGKPLDGERNRQGFFDLCEYAGEALAALQTVEAPFGPERGIDYLLGRLRERLEEARHLAPGLYPALRDLIGQIDHRAANLPPMDLVASHGDYKWDQFLEYRGRFSLIDFEFFCQADPAYDAGYFCAYVPSSRPDDWRDAAAAELCRSAFLNAYVEASGAPLPWSRVGLYEAAMLAIRGFTYVWSQATGWDQQAAQMIGLAFERLVSPEPAPIDRGS